MSAESLRPSWDRHVPTYPNEEFDHRPKVDSAIMTTTPFSCQGCPLRFEARLDSARLHLRATTVIWLACMTVLGSVTIFEPPPGSGDGIIASAVVLSNSIACHQLPTFRLFLFAVALPTHMNVYHPRRSVLVVLGWNIRLCRRNAPCEVKLFLGWRKV